MATDKIIFAPLGTVASLTFKIKTLLVSIEKRGRLLAKDRIRAGHLLIALREKFTAKNKDGVVLRGPAGGTFCEHLEASGLNVGTCYCYMRMAEGKLHGAEPVRVAYWQKFNRNMKKSTPAQKVALLKRAVAHIVKLYGVKADVTVRAK